MPHALGLRGLIAAPFTPFHDDGSLALEGIPAYAAHLRRAGVRGVFVNGTTGEGCSLSGDERRAAAEAWVDAAGRDLAMIVHVGANSLAEAAALAAHAEGIGAAAVGVLPPSFLKPRDAAMAAACLAEVAAACPRTPVTYYHIPALSGVALRAEDILAAAIDRVPNLGGLKFTHEDLHDFGRCIDRFGGVLDLAYGRDEMLLAGAATGAVLAVGSTYSLCPGIAHRILDAVAAGDLAAARTAQAELRAVVHVVQGHGGLAAMKTLLDRVGIAGGPCRMPLPTLSTAQGEALLADLTRTCPGAVP